MKQRQKVKLLKKRLKDYLVRKGIYGKHHGLGVSIVSSTRDVRGVQTDYSLVSGDIVLQKHYGMDGDVFVVGVHRLEKHEGQYYVKLIPMNNLITI